MVQEHAGWRPGQATERSDKEKEAREVMLLALLVLVLSG